MCIYIHLNQVSINNKIYEEDGHLFHLPERIDGSQAIVVNVKAELSTMHLILDSGGFLILDGRSFLILGGGGSTHPTVSSLRAAYSRIILTVTAITNHHSKLPDRVA